MPPKRLHEDADEPDEVEEVDAATDDEQQPAQALRLPRRRFFRQRAHCNPFSDHDLD